jgi:hypothetical protein
MHKLNTSVLIILIVSLCYLAGFAQQSKLSI